MNTTKKVTAILNNSDWSLQGVDHHSPSQLISVVSHIWHEDEVEEAIQDIDMADFEYYISMLDSDIDYEEAMAMYLCDSLAQSVKPTTYTYQITPR